MNALKNDNPVSALAQRSPAWLGLLVSGCLMLGLAGCVTEYSGGTQMASDPDATLEIITNSVLTSDNFSAQSVIDMETSPHLYMPPEMREQWQNLKGVDEMTSELVNSDKWRELVSNPRLRAG